MALVPVLAVKTVTTAGTATQFSTSTTTFPASIYVEALGTNTGYIYIGLSNVSSTNYICRLSAGEGFSFDTSSYGSGFKAGGQGLKLSAFYGDASVSGEKFAVTYLNYTS